MRPYRAAIPLAFCLMLSTLDANSAASREIYFNNNLGNSGTYIDPDGTKESFASRASGSAHGLANIDFGILKTQTQISSASSEFHPYVIARATFLDSIVADAGVNNDSTGWMSVRIEYEWLFSSTGSQAQTENTAVISFRVGNNGALAFENDKYGTANDQSVAAQTTGTAVVIGAEVGRYLEVLVPIRFGHGTSLSTYLETRSGGNDADVGVDAFHSAYWAGAHFYDSEMNLLDVTVYSDSGVDYGLSFVPSIPEPGTFVLFALGAPVLTAMRRRANKC